MAATCYRLTPNALLCGFRELPFGIFDRRKDRTHFFDQEEYAFILRLTGTELIEEEALTEKEKELLRSLKENGLAEAPASPAPRKRSLTRSGC